MQRSGFLMVLLSAAAACSPTSPVINDVNNVDAANDVVVTDATDATTDAGEEFVVMVVEGLRPVHPMQGARVRLRDATGVNVDTVTNARGEARFSIDLAHGPWDVTAAAPDHSAVSVLRAPRSLQGALRLDPLPSRDYGARLPVTGTITGRASDTNPVQIDCSGCDTVTVSTPSYASNFYEWPTGLSVTMVALEFDAARHNILNVATGADFVRGTQPIIADLAFPSPPRAPRRTTTTLVLPTAGRITAATTVRFAPNVQQGYVGDLEDSFRNVGLATVQPPVDNTIDIEWQSFAGDLEPNVGFMQLVNPENTFAINPVFHDFAHSTRLEIGQIDELSVTGTSLSSLRLTARTTGYDTHAIFIYGPPGLVPGWRCFTATGEPISRASLPDLPDGITPRDLGIGARTIVDVADLVMSDRAMPAWSSRALNGPAPEYALSVGAADLPISSQ